MIPTENPDFKKLQLLKEEIKHHEHLYYVRNQPEISDREFDLLIQSLLDLEKNYPQWITDDSPSQRVGGLASGKFNPVQHKLPMLSLDNTYNLDELSDFNLRVLKNLNLDSDVEYVVEPKIDGLGVSLIYEKGKFVQGVTRGDGQKGEDVTANLKTIRSIPLEIQMPDFNFFEVRGEVYIEKEKFLSLNRMREKEGLPLFVNPRNSAAGSLRLLDSRETAKRPLDIWVYSLGFTDRAPFRTHYEILTELRDLGFRVNPLVKIHRNFDAALKSIDSWEGRRHELNYEIDGLVFKVNDLNYQKTLGHTAKHPRFSVAYKFEAEHAYTEIIDIQVQVGRTGALTPVAKLKPVFVSGSTVSRASLHNEDEVKRLDARVGDRVVIEKAGEIIPKVIEVLSRDDEAGRGEAFQMPSLCPVCGKKVIRPEDEAIWRCVNASCPQQVKERMLHFASRSAMDIDHLGAAVVEQLVDGMRLQNYSDIYSLSMDEVIALDRFAEKSAGNLLDSIAKSKDAGLSRLIYALGIRHVGKKTADVLARTFHSFDNLIKACENIDELSSIDEIGVKIADSLNDFFQQDDNRLELRKLGQLGIRMTARESVQKENSAVMGKQFVLTGTLSSMNRDEAKEKILENGGRVSSAVSKKTDFVVAGTEPGSKARKAEKLNLHILTEEQFLELLSRGG